MRVLRFAVGLLTILEPTIASTKYTWSFKLSKILPHPYLPEGSAPTWGLPRADIRETLVNAKLPAESSGTQVPQPRSRSRLARSPNSQTDAEKTRSRRQEILREYFTTMANGRTYCLALVPKHARARGILMEHKYSEKGDAALSEDYERIEYLTNMRKKGIVMYDVEKERAMKHNWEGYELWERCWFFL